MITRVPIGALFRAAIEVEMIAQLLRPNAIETLADAGHARAKDLQVEATLTHYQPRYSRLANSGHNRNSTRYSSQVREWSTLHFIDFADYPSGRPATQARDMAVHEIVRNHHAPGSDIPEFGRNSIRVIAERKFPAKNCDFVFRRSGAETELT